jgi:hypothetical protein
MPVQFYCPHCRQLLKVGRRKIGSLVACPRCGAPTVVPNAQGGATPLAEESVAGFEEVNELLRQAPVVPQAPVAASPSASGWSSGSFQPAFPTQPVIETEPDATDMLLVSRTAIYAQAALFLLVACVAFAAGYWVGHSRAPAAASASAAGGKADPVRLSGQITYHLSIGQPVGDAGAVIIALPPQPPRHKWKAAGLRPEDALSAVHDDAVKHIDEAGGAYSHADQEGAYDLVVPMPAEYPLLVISNHAMRPAGEYLPERDLKLLAPYFEVVTDVIGSHQYTIAKQRLAGRPSWSHAF